MVARRENEPSKGASAYCVLVVDVKQVWSCSNSSDRVREKQARHPDDENSNNSHTHTHPWLDQINSILDAYLLYSLLLTLKQLSLSSATRLTLLKSLFEVFSSWPEYN